MDGDATDAFVRILQRQEHEIRQLLEKNRELEFRLLDLSQRQMNAMALAETGVRPIDPGDMNTFIVRLRAALKMGDD